MLTNIPVTGHELKRASEWRFLMLEIAHIMIFVMAIMFCLVIFFIYLMVRSIEHEWNAIEDPTSSFGKPDHDPWRSARARTLALALALPSPSPNPSPDPNPTPNPNQGVLRAARAP